MPEYGHLRLIDLCITRLEAQGPSRTCNESKEEEEDSLAALQRLGLLHFVPGIQKWLEDRNLFRLEFG